MKPRRGMSLAETLVAMMVGSIIAGIGVTLIGSLLRTEHVGRRHLSETRALDRLAEQFAADVHAATQVDVRLDITDPKAPAPLVSFTAATGERIDYRQQERALLRRESRDGTVVRQDAYRLPASHIVQATTEPADTPKWVTLRIDRSAAMPTSGYSTLRNGWSAVAEFGRDQRLASTVAADQGREVSP